MGTADTLPKLLMHNLKKYGDTKVAIRKKTYGIWKEYTWSDYYQNVKDLSLGLISLGLVPGDKVAIIGDNDPQWHWTQVAVEAACAISLGVFPDATPAEVNYILDHSDAKFAVVKDQEQVDKLLALQGELPKIQKVIYWQSKGLWNYDESILLSFEEAQKLGRSHEAVHPTVFVENVERGQAEDVAVFCYTSGTTGLPKGAMLTHSTLLACSRSWDAVYGLQETDQYLSAVLAAWIAEQWFGITPSLRAGTIVDFAEEPETAAEDTRDISPEILAYSARMWEGTASQIQAKIADSTFLKRLVFGMSLPVGYKMAEMRQERIIPGLFWQSLYRLIDFAMFRPIRDLTGARKARFTMSAGALLSPDIMKYFRALGIKIRQAYGVTEGGWVSCHEEDEFKSETMGRPSTEAQVRISDEGEVLIKGLIVFKGYYKDQKATDEKITDGWFHSGDAGHIDDDGHVIILDRMPDLMELAGGGKFSPSFIEGRLKFSPYIKDALTIGGKDRSYVTAIVNIDFDNIGRWAESRRIAYTTFVDLSQKQEVYALIRKDVERVNKSLPEAARVKRFVNLYKEFDPDEAELTRTRKIRRAYMEERYSNLITVLYGDVGEAVVETDVKYRDGKVGKMSTPIRVTNVGAKQEAE